MSYENRSLPKIYLILPVLALSIDLFTPFLIWKEVIPSEIRWVSHFAVALMILLAVFHIFSTNRFPASLWLVLAVSILWSYIAIEHRQGISSTLWGIWLLFQFPLISLFAYFQAKPSKQFIVNIRKCALILLSIQVGVQVLQYAFGEVPGDDLAGLFGNNGTGIALAFIILVNCLYLGYWIMSKSWTGFIIALGLSLLSSVLGELKIFPFMITATGLVASLIYAINHRSLKSLFNTLLLIIVAVAAFGFLYNSIVPAASWAPFQAYLQEPERLSEYLNFSKSGFNSEGARYSNIGRMEAIEIGWNSIKKDPITLLFGYGVGARSESRTLGTTGVGLSSGSFGWSTGTSLLVLMQETGVIGLTTLVCIIVWIVFALAQHNRAMPDSPANSLRYALFLFSMLLPVLLWYTNIWTMRVPMLGYWYLLGCVLAEARSLKAQVPGRAAVLSVQGA